MAIDDGYNQFAVLQLEDKAIRIEYRPALRRERLELFNRIVMLSDNDLGYELMADEVQVRVINASCSSTESISVLLWDRYSEGFLPAVRCVLGQHPYFNEEEDARNLREGVWLLLHYPSMANLSCDYCRKWQMDPVTGEVFDRGGKPIPRLPEDVLLCEVPGEECPKGSYQNPKGLSAKNRKALRHYLECKAVGQFPDDAIVRRNAKIISDEFRKFELEQQRKREQERLRRARV